MNLPEEDLHIYQMLFEIEYSKEVVKEKLSRKIKEFKQSIEKIHKHEFKVLENISGELLLEWLKFNFIHLQEETDELNKYYNQEEYEIEPLLSEDFNYNKKVYKRHIKVRRLKETVIRHCNICLKAIEIKTNKWIPKYMKELSFPDKYNKFKKALPDMIEYRKKSGKKVFYRGNLSKQFLKWYNS